MIEQCEDATAATEGGHNITLNREPGVIPRNASSSILDALQCRSDHVEARIQALHLELGVLEASVKLDNF